MVEVNKVDDDERGGVGVLLIAVCKRLPNFELLLLRDLLVSPVVDGMVTGCDVSVPEEKDLEEDEMTVRVLSVETDDEDILLLEVTCSTGEGDGGGEETTLRCSVNGIDKDDFAIFLLLF